jgi:hypothetical protein
MTLLDGRTDSPTALGWQFSPCQTHSCENHKTVIRHAADIRSEAKAKLRKTNKPMKSGTRPTSSPNRTATRCRATYTEEVWSYWFFIGLRSKALCSRAEALLSLVRTTRSCSRIQSRGDSKGQWSAAVVIPLCERGKSASQTRQTGDTAAQLGRQHSSASHPIDGFHQNRKPTPTFGRTASTGQPRPPTERGGAEQPRL